jgi:hypothetical protein
MDYWYPGKRLQVFIFLKLHLSLTQLIRYLFNSNFQWSNFVQKVKNESIINYFGFLPDSYI